MLTTLLVSAGTKVMSGFGLNKKAGDKSNSVSQDSPATPAASAPTAPSATSGVNGGSMAAVAMAGMITDMTMRGGIRVWSVVKFCQ